MSICKFQEQLRKDIDNERKLRKTMKNDTHYLNKTISIVTEKFYRYSHNLNLEKAINYKNKINDLNQELLDVLMDNSYQFEVEVFKENFNNSSIDKNEGSILSFSKNMKYDYKINNDIIECIKGFIKN